MAGMVKMIKLSCPHLILSNFSCDNGISTGQLMDFLNNKLRLDDICFFNISEWMLIFPCFDLLKPRNMFFLYSSSVEAIISFDIVIHSGQGMFTVRHHWNINLHIFTDGCGININMNNLGMRSKSRDLTCYSVIKTCSDSDQYIAVGDRHI